MQRTHLFPKDLHFLLHLSKMTENSSKGPRALLFALGRHLSEGKTLSSPGKVEGVSWIYALAITG